MNGGTPSGGSTRGRGGGGGRAPDGGSAHAFAAVSGAPLRALRHAPVLVDDVGPLPRLAAAARLAASGDASADSPAAAADAEELVRWTRAWLVVWQGALQAAGVIGAEAPWTVPVPLAAVPTLKGDPERRRRDAALALLARAGLVALDADGARATLGEPLFVGHRAGLEVDWARAGAACRHEPAALLVLRALAELVSPLDALTPVSLRELAGRTGYGEKQVRVALRRLAEAGVLHAAEAPGQPARYRLTDAALGRERAAAAPPAPALVDRGTPAASPAPSAPAEPGAALRLTLNGVTVSLAAGMTVHVDYDADGVPRLTVAPRPSAG